MLKRIFDLTIAIVSLVIFGPAMIAVALLVRVRLGSPILFVQDRPGLHGRIFRMYKFRTMNDACDPDSNPVPDERRLTPLGRFLRESSLDELPELLNVVRGDMSIVGPRPLLIEYLDLYTDEQKRRHEVRPGITGWAQIHGRNDQTWEQRFALDIWYVDHGSLPLDLKILLKTISKVLAREGISSRDHATMPKFRGGRQ